MGTFSDWVDRTFGGGSSSSSSSSSSSNSSDDDNNSPNTLGSVSQTGQYAGDGFEWVQNDNTNALTRVYTGANEGAGLGTDVIAGGTSDNDTKAVIANISLNEGSEFANSASSSTDNSALDIFRAEEDKVGSGSYAEQVGVTNYTPTITYDSTSTGAENAAAAAATPPVVAPVVEPPTFGEVFAANRAAGADTFSYNGALYNTNLAPTTPAAVGTGLGSFRPVARPTNLLSSQEQALVDAYNAVPDSDESYTPDSATLAALLKSQNQTSAIADPLSVADQVASYGGVNLDAQDEATTAANNAAAATAFDNSDFDYTVLDRGQGGIGPGSPLPDDSVVADASGSWEEFFKTASPQDIQDLAGSGVQLETSYDAFGNEYATAEQAAQADIDANNAAVMANNPNFEAQFPGDVPEGIISSSADIAPPTSNLSASDLLKYTAIGLPANVGEMATGLGENLNLTSPLNTLQGFNQRNSGVMSIPIALTNRILESFMSPEEKQRRILAADPNRQGSSISKALTDSGDFLTNTVSPYISDFLNPGSQQAVFEGDLGDKVSVTGVDGTNLTGTEATQGIGNTVAAEGIADAGLDVALSSNPYTRAFSGALNAGEQLSGFSSDISSQIDNAYVSGSLDDNQVFKDALAAQNGDVDNALAAVKNLAYSDGYAKIAASGAVDAVIPGMKSGLGGVAKEGLKRGGVEMGQGAYEGYQAISSINNVLGTDFDPTKNIVGNALTEGVAGTGAVVVAGGANALSARQRRDAADEEALMSQPVAAPYGGMDTSGITPGFNKARSPGSAGSPGTIEGQYSVFDPNISPTAGDPASSTVPSAYDLEGPEAGGLAITDQRDPMTTSMETMAAQEIINDQVNQTGAVDFGILQRIQNATGLSMNELGSMVDSATSTKLTPDQIAAIESAPVGDVMTNAPVAPGFDDEVTGNFGGSNISVKPNADGTTTLTAPSGRISVVDPGQDLDQAIKVFDEIVTPIDVQTDAPVLKDSGQGLAAPDLSAAPFASTNTGGVSSLVLPSGADPAPVVDTSSADFEEVSDAEAVVNAEAIKAQEVAYTKTKAETGSDTAAEAAGEAAYNSSIATASASDAKDSGTEVIVAPTTDVTTNADGTTDVAVDGTTDLTTAAATDLTVDSDTDSDTDTTAVTVVDNTIDGTATEISGAITDQTTDNDTSPKVVVVPDTKVLTEVEPPEEEVEVEVEEDEVPGGDVTVDVGEDDTFVPVITSTDDNGDTITECPEGYTMVEGPDGPICQKSVTTTVRRQRAGASTRAYTGLAGNRGRVGPGQRSRSNTTTTTETVDPTTRSA